MPSGLPASAPPLPLRCPVGGAAAYGVAQPLLPSVAPPQRRAPGAIPRCGGTWVGRGSYPRAVTRPSSWRRRGLRAWPFRLVSISVDVRRAHGPWLFRAALVLGGGGGGSVAATVSALVAGRRSTGRNPSPTSCRPAMVELHALFPFLEALPRCFFMPLSSRLARWSCEPATPLHAWPWRVHGGRAFMPGLGDEWFGELTPVPWNLAAVQ